MTFGEATAQVKDQGGFYDDARVGGWINGRYSQAVARARWLMAELELGPSIAGETRYRIPSNVVDIERLRLGGTDAFRIGPGDMWNLKTNVVGSSGLVYAPGFSDSGATFVEFYPVPGVDGDAVAVLAALEPPLLVNGSDVPIIPTDLHDAILVDGAIAQGLRRMDERIADADSFEARYEGGVQELQRRRNSRVGQGPIQAQVAGYHF